MTIADQVPASKIDTVAWRPVYWNGIAKDDVLTLTQHGAVLAVGTVDEVAPDHSVVWIRHAATGERQLFLTEDALKPWQRKPDEK